MSAFSASRAGRVVLIPRHPHLWFVGFALSQALVAALWWRLGTAIGSLALLLSHAPFWWARSGRSRACSGRICRVFGPWTARSG